MLSFQDDATVQQLCEDNSSGDVQGWIRRCHAWLFEGDLFADVAADATLMRIHATAEEFDPATEESFVPFQVISCFMLKALAVLSMLHAKILDPAVFAQGS